ncbi:MAG: hypothetical protein XE01_1270 [Synergistales bacterium 58_81]|nr:MAG: hypothetical protein XE01_1270 [Synergistales bacterium 58_81]
MKEIENGAPCTPLLKFLQEPLPAQPPQGSGDVPPLVELKPEDGLDVGGSILSRRDSGFTLSVVEEGGEIEGRYHIFKFGGGVTAGCEASHDGPDTCSNDAVDGNVPFLEHLKNTDVGETPRPPSGEDKDHSSC